MSGWFPLVRGGVQRLKNVRLSLRVSMDEVLQNWEAANDPPSPLRAKQALPEHPLITPQPEYTPPHHDTLQLHVLGMANLPLQPGLALSGMILRHHVFTVNE